MNTLTEFCSRHHITVVDTQKTWCRFQQKYKSFAYPLDASLLVEEEEFIRRETEPLYTIQIPESQLIRIQEFEDQVFNNMKEHGHFNLFSAIMDQRVEEKRLRDLFPGVKKAFEKYSMMLNLCRKT